MVDVNNVANKPIIQGQDNQKKIDFSKPQLNVTPTPQPVSTANVAPLKADTLTLSKKPSGKLSKELLQTTALIVTTAASAVIAAMLLKNVIPSKEAKKLVDIIKKNGAPEDVMEKVRFEYGKTRTEDKDSAMNYLKQVSKLIWKDKRSTALDLNKAEESLKKIIGQEKVKEEFMVYLKNEKFRLDHNVDGRKRKILCLVGPPGVGKTAFAEVAAEAMGKEFSRISVSGKSKASDIIGSDRVWKNASPGGLMRAAQKSKSNGPLILIDELDKLGESMEHGSPKAALLDAFEPKQCKNFTDEFFDFNYDLSNTTFVVTANNKNNIPRELLDRLDIIELSPYSQAEKIKICQASWGDLLKGNGMKEDAIKILPEAMNELTNTADSGARKSLSNMERILEQINADIVDGKPEVKEIDKKFVINALKNRKNID